MNELTFPRNPFCKWELTGLPKVPQLRIARPVCERTCSEESQHSWHTVGNPVKGHHSMKVKSTEMESQETQLPGCFPSSFENSAFSSTGCNHCSWDLRKKKSGVWEKHSFGFAKWTATGWGHGPDLSCCSLGLYNSILPIQRCTGLHTEPEIKWLFLKVFYFKSLWVTNDLASFQHCASCGFSCQSVTYGRAWEL